MIKKWIVTLAVCLLPVGVLHADEIDMSDAQVIDNARLATLRGGFQLANDYIVDIGISITTAINGQNIYRTTIASLVFQNGVLLPKLDNYPSQEKIQGNPGLINVVQLGEGNIVEGALPASVEVFQSESGQVSPASTGPSASSTGTAEVVSVQPASVQPSAVQPSAVQPGAVQPGAVQPGAVQPEYINSSVINIIQNTLDHSVIGLNTVVDIEAQADSVAREIRADLRLKDALLHQLQ